MSKEKILLEYILHTVSPSVLWPYLSSPSGLAGWFSDDVKLDGRFLIFHWKKSTEEAEQIAVRPNRYVRFRWRVDENTKYYFEFNIAVDEITQETILEITDFASPEEKQDTVSLWNAQVEELKRILGVLY
ncbi:MAG: SRPBCC domain-containing protein [Bacteroidales bacterium]|jgi:uncharacterized protein YndB with AHSA1/START domain|nr:SRPBCC domain-containing protein [Bacteroidales bacterium]